MRSAILYIALAACCVGMAAAQMHPIMPGVDAMSRGFDMVAGVQKSDVTSKELLPVFSWTYTGGQTWTDPTNTSRVYSVPDQLVPTTLDESQKDISMAIQDSYSEYVNMERMSFNIGVGVTIGQGTKAFSGNVKFNHESARFNEETRTSNVASGISRAFWSLFSLEAYPPQFMKSNPMWASITGALPTTIKSAADQEKYNQVIQYWGTHFTSYANFGGNLHVNTFVNKTILTGHSQSWVENQLALTFHYYLFSISGGGFRNRSSIHISHEFAEAAHTFIYFRGGNLELQTNTTASEWVASIPTSPVYLNCTISDLSVLIDNTAIAANMRKVIQVYIDTGKLPDTNDDYDYEAFYAGMPDPQQVGPSHVIRDFGGR